MEKMCIETYTQSRRGISRKSVAIKSHIFFTSFKLKIEFEKLPNRVAALAAKLAINNNILFANKIWKQCILKNFHLRHYHVFFNFRKHDCSKTYTFQTCYESRRGLSRESIASKNFEFFTSTLKLSSKDLCTSLL